jgi:hypothetical protein
VPNQPAGNFLSFSSSPAISGNTVAFEAESHSTDGIYTGTVGGTNLSVVADGSTTVPGQGVDFTGFGALSLSDGNVAFIGDFGASSVGLFTESQGVLAEVLQKGDSFMAAQSPASNWVRPASTAARSPLSMISPTALKASPSPTSPALSPNPRHSPCSASPAWACCDGDVETNFTSVDQVGTKIVLK